MNTSVYKALTIYFILWWSEF